MYVGNNGKGWLIRLRNESGRNMHRDFAWVVRSGHPGGGSWSFGVATYFGTRDEAVAVMAVIPKESMKEAQALQGLY
jgi:hypothetical protein